MLRCCLQALAALCGLQSVDKHQLLDGFASFDVNCEIVVFAASGRGNALEVVMGIWIERQLEFMGTYRINLATTALVQMLASRHPALMSLQVVTQL